MTVGHQIGSLLAAQEAAEMFTMEDLGEREERPGPPGLVRVGTVVEQVRPIARSFLADRDPSDVGVIDLRGNGKSSRPGEPAEVYYVFACVGDEEIEFVWKRAVEGECLERLAVERRVYAEIAGRTRRVPTLYAEMNDSDSGGGIAIEHLPRLAQEVYVGGEPNRVEVGRLAAALMEFARDIPVTGRASSYLEAVARRFRRNERSTMIWKFVTEFFCTEGRQLDKLDLVMSPGFASGNIGFRKADPAPVFFDLDTVCARPIGSGLVTGLAFRADFDDLVPVIQESMPGLSVEDVYLLALGEILERWGEGDARGRPGACRCLDALGIPISDEIRSS